MMAGLDYAKGDAVIFIDADLQDPPELIKEMINLWENGNEVIYAKRTKRKGESPFKLLTAKMKFEIEWQFITVSIAQRIMKEFADFNALVVYKDLITGKEKTGYFYPGDYQPVPSTVYQNREMLYKSFPLNIIEK